MQLTIAIDFISSKDLFEEECVIHLSSDNIKCASYTEVNEAVNELFKPLRSKYQENSEALMKGTDFVFDSVRLMYYKCHKVKNVCGDSYIDSSNWIKQKKKIPQN